MSKKRAVILEQDRDKRLQMAAALKGPELGLTMLENESDLLADFDKHPADLYVLRAEMDKASGYSVCNRLRSQERSQHAKIVIVATATSDPRLPAHRLSAQAADTYIVPPLGLKDLRLQAYSLLDLDGGTLSEEEFHAVEEDPLSRLDEMMDGAKVQDSSLTAEDDAAHKQQTNFTDDDLDNAFGALDGTAKPQAPAPQPEEVIEEAELLEEQDIHEVPSVAQKPSPLAQLSEEDLSFVTGSFQRAPQAGPPAPPPSQRAQQKELRGPEAKIAMLRDSLRDREQELSRLQGIWHNQELQYRQSAQRVAEMEIEVKAVQMEAADLRRKVKIKEDENARVRRESGAATDRLLEEKVMLEKDLIEVVASKEKTVAEQRRMLSSREKDNEQLRADLDRSRADLQRFQEDASNAMSDLRQQTDNALEIMRVRHVEEKDALDAAARQRDQELTERLSESERQWFEKFTATDTVRARLDEELLDTKLTLESTEAERARLEQELRMKEQALNEAYTQIASETDRFRGVAQERDDGLARIAELSADLEAREQRLKSQEEDLNLLKTDKDGLASRLGERLQQKDQVVEQLTKEVQVSREEREALVSRLGERLRERETTVEAQRKQIDQLQLDKMQVQTRADELQQRLDDERKRLQNESEVMSLKLVELQQQATEKLSAQLLEMEQLKQLIRTSNVKAPEPDVLEDVSKKLDDIPQP